MSSWPASSLKQAGYKQTHKYLPYQVGMRRPGKCPRGARGGAGGRMRGSGETYRSERQLDLEGGKDTAGCSEVGQHGACMGNAK